MRCRTAHYIAFHIAAGSQCGEFNFVDPPNGFVQIALEHAMQLQALAAREPQRAIAQLVAHIEFAKKLIGASAVRRAPPSAP